MLSVICPIYNEKKYISICIDSILEQDYPKDSLEVIFVDGMSQDGTREIIGQYSKKYPNISLIDNPKRIVPIAMNMGINASKGDIIIRLDAHAKYPSNYFRVLTKALIDLHADNVGAVCRTEVLNKTQKSLAIKEVLSNKFGVGNSTFRTGISKIQEVDTVPFGCWKRETFLKYGQFDTRLVRNQDIELNKRIKRGGGHIFIIPDTYCTYMAREDFMALFKNNFNNGKWNILTVYYTKQFNSLSFRHFIPLLFILSILLPTLGVLIYPYFGILALISIVCYIILIGGISFKTSYIKKLNFFYLLMSFTTLHISYGLGSLFGIKTVCINKITNK